MRISKGGCDRFRKKNNFPAIGGAFQNLQECLTFGSTEADRDTDYQFVIGRFGEQGFFSA